MKSKYLYQCVTLGEDVYVNDIIEDKNPYNSYDRFDECNSPFQVGIDSNLGWICPTCGRVNSPTQKSCECFDREKQ